VPFVGGLRSLFARQWPALGMEQGRPGQFTRTYPFPECWPLHAGLVLEFALLRTWTTVSETGEIELSAIGTESDRWMRHVHEVTVLRVREIAQLCVRSGTTRHIDPSVPRPGFGVPSRMHRWGAARPAAPFRREPLASASRGGRQEHAAVI
jgi:hypothetical protein